MNSSCFIITLLKCPGIGSTKALNYIVDNNFSLEKCITNIEKIIPKTEFDLYATYDMIANNTHEQIEILRERFISDLCNLIANFIRDGSIKMTSFTIDSLNDKQNHMLTVLNDVRRINGEPIFLTVYGGYYYDNFDRKEGNVKLSLVSTKGGMDILYGLVIIAVLIIVIAVVSHIFVNL